MQVKGMQTRIITALETTYKTAPTGFTVGTIGTILQPYASESIKKSNNLSDSKILKPSRNASKVARGNYEVSGDLKTELSPHLYALIAYAMGSRATVDSAGSPATITENVITVGTAPYTHTFKIGNLPSFALEKKFSTLSTPKYYQFLGCRASKLSIDINSDGLVDMTLGVMGADLTISSNSMGKNSGQDDYDIEYSHVPFESFELAAANVKIGGVAVAYISKISLSIENNLDGNLYVIGGAGLRQELPDGIVKVSGKITALFGDTTGADSQALITAALAGTESAIDLKFRRGSGSEGSAGNESLRIVIPELIFTVNTPQVTGPTGIMLDMDFTGYYENSSDATTLMIVLMNSDAPRL